MSIADKAKNKAEEALRQEPRRRSGSRLTTKVELEAEGRDEQAKADLKQAGEKVKDAAKDVKDAFKS